MLTLWPYEGNDPYRPVYQPIPVRSETKTIEVTVKVNGDETVKKVTTV